MPAQVSIAMSRDRILVKELDQQMLGKLHLPTGYNDNKHVPLGTIVAIGPGLLQNGMLEPVSIRIRNFDPAEPGQEPDWSDEGQVEEMVLRPGMDVYFLKAGAVPLELDGQKYFVVHQPSIVALASIKVTNIVT